MNILSKETSNLISDSSIGSYDWSIATILGIKCASTINYMDPPVFDRIMLYNGSEIGTGPEKFNSTVTTSEYYGRTKNGGPSDLWGASLTPAIVNSSSFGIRIEMYISATDEYTYPLIATGFGFNIPTDATINGVQVTITNRFFEGQMYIGNTDSGLGDKSSVYMDIAYTPAPTDMITNASMKNLYNAWKGTSGTPATTASLAGISARSAGTVSLGRDFKASGMRFAGGSSSYYLPSKTTGVTVDWDLLGTGSYVQRLKKAHSFTISSDNESVIAPAASGLPITDTTTRWDANEAGNAIIYISVVNGYINTWVGASWSDADADALVRD